MRAECSPNVASVERALAILEFLDGSRRDWRMSAISRKLGIPKSSAHVLVLTLQRAGYLDRPTASKGYTLGPRARNLGRAAAWRESLADMASPHMNRLAHRTKLTVHLAVRDGNQGVYIQKAQDPDSIPFDTYVGKRINLHCTAVGKVILAHEERRFSHDFLTHGIFARHTVNTITTPAHLKSALQAIYRRGCALDNEEEELQVRCLSVPVFTPAGSFVAALGVAGTSRQISGDNRALIETVKTTASSIYRNAVMMVF